MKTRLAAFVLAASCCLQPLTVRAQASPDTIEGEVLRIDPDHQRVTVRTSSGDTVEFTADAETLRALKPGDHIEAKKRGAPK